MMKMRTPFEAEIKVALLEFCKANGLTNNGVAIANEFTFNKATRRADIVLASNNLHAFEIKSEADSLGRLVSQTETYLKYCDYVTAVIAEKYIKQVSVLMPEYVGIWCFDGKRIRLERKATQRIGRRKQHYIELLTARELRRLLSDEGFVSSGLRRSLMNEMAFRLPLETLRQTAIEAVKARFSATTETFWSSCSNRHLRVEDLKLLSPYSDIRAQTRLQNNLREEFWADWSARLHSTDATVVKINSLIAT